LPNSRYRCERGRGFSGERPGQTAYLRPSATRRLGEPDGQRAHRALPCHGPSLGGIQGLGFPGTGRAVSARSTFLIVILDNVTGPAPAVRDSLQGEPAAPPNGADVPRNVGPP
jgi:hypothetical protein